MIKLSRGEKPEELTNDVCEELKKLYAEDKDRDVWNSSKIKEPLKKAMLEMSYGKCSYCECKLRIESKDVTIDHFLPKSDNPDEVVEWENLFPACLRCNRKKNKREERIVNPCVDEPKEYLGVTSVNRYRLKGIDTQGIGKNTIEVIGLNDIERVMVPRMTEWEALKEHLEEIEEDLKEEGYKNKYRNRLQKIMENCLFDKSYAAVKATNLLNDSSYLQIKDYFIKEDQWSDTMKNIEAKIKEIALKLV